MVKENVYQPQYYKKFSCIGSECKDNCCRYAWKIVIDKGTYDKYMGFEGSEKEEIEKGIRVTSEDPFIAEMVYGENDACRFLDSNGRCSIQLKHGHEYLCYTCRIYPRRICDVQGEIEAFMELSCEVVAKLILFDQNIMKFETVVHENEERILCNRRLLPEKYVPTGDGVEIFWKIRTASIVIVQSRQYRFWTRMLILGSFIQQAAELLATGRQEEIPKLSGDFIERLDKRHYDGLAKEKPTGADLGYEFLNEVLQRLEARKDKILCRNIAKAREGLGITPGEDLPEGFNEAYQRYYEMFLGDKEYIFENYVMAHIFTDGFPFNYAYTDSIMKNYKELLVKSNVVKLLLVGICRANMKFDKRRVVECVASFSRMYDHIDEGFFKMK